MFFMFIFLNKFPNPIGRVEYHLFPFIIFFTRVIIGNFLCLFMLFFFQRTISRFEGFDFYISMQIVNFDNVKCDSGVSPPMLLRRFMKQHVSRVVR